MAIYDKRGRRLDDEEVCPPGGRCEIPISLMDAATTDDGEETVEEETAETVEEETADAAEEETGDSTLWDEDAADAAARAAYEERSRLLADAWRRPPQPRRSLADAPPTTVEAPRRPPVASADAAETAWQEMRIRNENAWRHRTPVRGQPA